MYVFDYGAPVGSVASEFYELDVAFTRREGYEEAQSDLIYDYHTNVAMYPAFQAYLRGYRPPLLAIWGENDPSFVPEGAKAFLSNLPRATVRFVPSGHFALESHCKEIAQAIKEWYSNLNI